LAVFSREFRDQYSDDGWKVLEQKLLNPIMVDWHKGFYTPECITAENIWRWCMRRGEINILNASNESRTITLQMTCGTLNREPSRLEIESDLFSADLQIDETGRQYEKTLASIPCVSFAMARPLLPPTIIGTWSFASSISPAEKKTRRSRFHLFILLH
jgi:hypothetical protein